MRFRSWLTVLAASAAGGSATAQPTALAEAPQTASLSAAEARSTASSFADILERNYVFPDVARHYAEALRAKAQAGGYDGAGNAEALARMLTADALAVAPDNHLRVVVGDGRGPRVPVANGAAAAPARVRPPAIEEPRWLAPGIAYVRFNVFPGDPAVTEASGRFMADHAEAETMIFDIRTHGGGGLDQMDAMLPYLFAKPTRLVTMDTRGDVARAGGGPLDDRPTLPRVETQEDVVRREHVVTPHPSEKRLHDAKVILLTSNYTASAAEHFALAMKRTGRATLIGETTGGAGNYGGMQPIGSGLSAFIPVGRTFDPDTGRGWEGTGVEPHVQVPAERALVEALVRSGVSAEDAERLSAEVHPQGPMHRARRG